ncbi:arginine--tRNA ligase [Candidatus Similichlamydia laticola]|uniref:arginine--tRNA ligase n=1 Tax=Candidatus Similichlamydia laticola TaxID=2170265 RepID=UPI001C6A1527|nr:arginine--tRNA ligase [Candidatus Similichlamydia laticola]
MSIAVDLACAVRSAVLQACPELEGQIGLPALSRCRLESGGDFQCNDVMKWSKLLDRSPAVFAAELAPELRQIPFVEEISVSGPGFLNIRCRSSWLVEGLRKVLEPNLLFQSKKVLLDFSSPNVAKEMHVGHLRSTILGECLARLFRFLGAEVIKLNHLGDWGTQFGMILAFLCDHPIPLHDLDLTQVCSIYRQAKQQFDADPSFKKRAHQQVVSLQKGEKAAWTTWKRLCDLSEESYSKIYSLLGIENLISRGESFYCDQLQEMVADLREAGHVDLSDGASCIFVEGHEMPYMIQKSDGGFNYDTTDLAALRYRVEVEKGDILVYVTDLGQKLHFQLLESVARKVNYLPASVSFVHVPFGLVLGEDGKKFRTRSGSVEPLTGLLSEAIQRAGDLLVEKGWDREDSDFSKAAEILGIGSVKFLDLINHRIHDYRFSYDKMLQFEGKTAPFLFYARVRALSILRRTKREEEHPSLDDLEGEEERALALCLLEFPDSVERALQCKTPHLLAEYAYQLAKQFHSFFRDCRVEGSPRERPRSALCAKTAQVLGKSLELLGIGLLDRM